jgi:hypothetical protein
MGRWGLYAAGVALGGLLGCFSGELPPPATPAPAPAEPAPFSPTPTEITDACAATTVAIAEIDKKVAAGDNAGAVQIVLATNERFGPYLDMRLTPPEVQAVAEPWVARLSYFQAGLALEELQAHIAGNRATEAEATLKRVGEALQYLTGDFAATPAARKVREDYERAQKQFGPQLEQIRQGDAAVAKFCEVLQQHAQMYAEAPNDLKRSAVRAARAKALRAAVPNGRAIRWLGTIKTLTTTGQGNAVLELELPCAPFGMGSWNNELSDIGYNSLIPIGSPSFEALSNMAPGTPIRIDGTLILDPDRLDGWGEVSVTEKGSMNGGFFLIRLDGR